MRGVFPDVGFPEKSATSGEAAVMKFVRTNELLPPALRTVRFTEYIPGVVYVCDGFLNVEVFPAPVSPNVQLHPVGVPVEVSVKTTMSGENPEVGAPIKLAVGGTIGVIGGGVGDVGMMIGV